MLSAVVDPGRDADRANDPSVRRSASTWRLIVGLFVLVALLVVVDLVRTPGPDPLGWSLAVGLATLALLAVIYHREVLTLAERQQAETESLNRILQGLSRSASPDAVLGGIVNELRAATGADHCVVVRRRPRSRLLDATLVSGSAGVPAASTTLPSVLLEIAQGEPRPRSETEIREAALEALADETRHMLEEGVVASAKDIDTALIIGAGFPFFMGGLTKYLDQTGVSERVVGRKLADVGAATPA